MAHVDYYKCDRCGREGREKFSHVSVYGHRHFDMDLCRDCVQEIASPTSIAGRFGGCKSCVLSGRIDAAVNAIRAARISGEIPDGIGSEICNALRGVAK